MSKKEKLVDRLVKKTKDFTFDEMEALSSGILKRYVLDQVIEKLRKDDLI